MSSILGKCIAIAATAAIALAWYSPPAYAQTKAESITKANKQRDAALSSLRKAEASATDAERDAVKAGDASGAAQADVKMAKAASDAAAAAAAAIGSSPTSSVAQKTQATDIKNAAMAAYTKAMDAAGMGDADAALTATIAPGQAANSSTAAGYAGLARGRSGRQLTAGSGAPASAAAVLDADLATADPDAAVDSAWALAKYAKLQYDEAVAQATTAAATATTDTEAEEAADNAEEAAGRAMTAANRAAIARADAMEAAKRAKERAAEAKKQAAEAKKQAGTVTGAAVMAAEADVKKAQADYDKDDSATNKDALDRAKAALAKAKDAAAKYGGSTTTPPGDDDDDDDTTGDDDDDDDTDGMAEVTANGVGNLLKFGFWTTMGRDTLLAVTNLGKANETVAVKIMDGMGMVKGTITVCLVAGDTWTAAMVASEDGMSSMVTGRNPGSCSGAMPDTALMATYGFIEVYPADMDMDMNGHLMGIATVVNTEEGFASSYNATSLMAELDAEAEAKMDAIEEALAMEGGIQKDMLLGRWGANAAIGGMTQIMLTFPVPGTAPTGAVAINVADEAGNYSTMSSMMLNKAVNMCTFMTNDTGATTLSCNGSTGMPVTVNEGWFKIMAPAGMMGFPVIGMVSQSFEGTLGTYDQSYPVQWMEMEETAAK